MLIYIWICCASEDFTSLAKSVDHWTWKPGRWWFFQTSCRIRQFAPFSVPSSIGWVRLLSIIQWASQYNIFSIISACIYMCDGTTRQARLEYQHLWQSGIALLVGRDLFVVIFPGSLPSVEPCSTWPLRRNIKDSHSQFCARRPKLYL